MCKRVPPGDRGRGAGPTAQGVWSYCYCTTTTCEHRGTGQTHLDVRVSPWSPPYMSQRQSFKEAVHLKTHVKTNYYIGSTQQDHSMVKAGGVRIRGKKENKPKTEDNTTKEDGKVNQQI